MSEGHHHHHGHHHHREEEDGYNNRPPPVENYGQQDDYARRPAGSNYVSDSYAGDSYGYGDENDGYRRTSGYQQDPYGTQGSYDNEGGYDGRRPSRVNVQTTEVYQQTANVDGVEHTRTEIRKHKKEEELGGIGALAAGAFALYEGHERKSDPAHAGRHKLEEELAGAAAAGAGGFALYERHEKKQSEGELRHETGEKKHHWFG